MMNMVNFALEDKIVEVSGLRLMEIADTVVEYDKELNLTVTKSRDANIGRITQEQYRKFVCDENNKNIILHSQIANFATVENQSGWFMDEVRKIIIQ